MGKDFGKNYSQSGQHDCIFACRLLKLYLETEVDKNNAENIWQVFQAFSQGENAILTVSVGQFQHPRFHMTEKPNVYYHYGTIIYGLLAGLCYENLEEYEQAKNCYEMLQKEKCPENVCEVLNVAVARCDEALSLKNVAPH